MTRDALTQPVTRGALTPPVRVFPRQIAQPLPLGMSGLAIASFIESGLELRWIGTNQSTEVGLILVSVPFVMQLLASVFSYLTGDGAGGAAIGVLCTTWLAAGLIHLVSTPGSTSGALGLLLLVAGAMLALLAVAVGRVKPLPAAVFLTAAVRFELAGIYQCGGAVFWRDVSGILGVALTALAGYCVLAFELESQNGDAVLPTFRR